MPGIPHSKGFFFQKTRQTDTSQTNLDEFRITDTETQTNRTCLKSEYEDYEIPCIRGAPCPFDVQFKICPGLLTFCLKSNGIPRNLCGRIQAGERATRVTEVASFDAKMKQSLALEAQLELVGDSSTAREFYAYFHTKLSCETDDFTIYTHRCSKIPTQICRIQPRPRGDCVQAGHPPSRNYEGCGP